QRAPPHETFEADVHVVPHVAVRVADHLQTGLGVHADQTSGRDGQAVLLVHLAGDGVAHGLPDLHGAARQTPLPAVRALLQQEAPAAIEDDGGDAGTDPEGALVVTLEGDQRHTVPDAAGARNITPRRTAAGIAPSARAAGPP